MIIVCQQCNSRFSLEEKRITKESALVKCSKCGNIFTVYRPQRPDDIHFINLENAKSTKIGPTVIAISNQKGGVAKTTTCLNLGVSLAAMKKRVLLIDFDVQANLSLSLGYQGNLSFYTAVADGNVDLKKIVVQTSYRNLWLLPSHKKMVLLNKKYFSSNNFEFLLKDRLIGISKHFDYILIDTPPSIEFFTLNALTASGLAIIPSQCNTLSAQGVHQVMTIINLIRKKTNPDLSSKLLLTMVDKASVASKLVSKKLKEMYGEMTFETVIEMDEKVKESQIMSQALIQYDRQSAATRQYFALAKEMLAARSSSPD